MLYQALEREQEVSDAAGTLPLSSGAQEPVLPLERYEGDPLRLSANGLEPVCVQR